jgi:hypothetical protein
LDRVAAEPVKGFSAAVCVGTLSDFIRARLRHLAHDKLPTRRILAVLRELAPRVKLPYRVTQISETNSHQKVVRHWLDQCGGRAPSKIAITCFDKGHNNNPGAAAI